MVGPPLLVQFPVGRFESLELHVEVEPQGAKGGFVRLDLVESDRRDH
jgi:hypothetical protein